MVHIKSMAPKSADYRAPPGGSFRALPDLDYRTVEGSVDGTFGGAMWQYELNRKHDTHAIQKGYKMHRREVDDPAPNLLPRESLAQRRARIEALMR